MYSQDGYRLIRAEQLLGALSAYNNREISFRAFRAYLGCFELLARREAAERSKPKRGQRNRRFLPSELSLLIDGEESGPITRELSSLRKAGLAHFTAEAISVSEGTAYSRQLIEQLGGRGGRRLVPVPRQIIKYLAGCSKPAVVKTVVAYLLRGLTLNRTGEIRSAGTVKVSWICKLCNLSERAVRSARAELIRLGWITRDVGSYQRKLNRDGAYFVINTAWSLVAKRFAPLGAKKCTENAPPIERPETPNGSKNQKAVLPAVQPNPARTLSKTGVLKPTIKNIQIDDLRRLTPLKELYSQAVRAKWLTDSEANLRNFLAAAARSTRVNGDAVRVFVGIVKRGLWHHLTQRDEDRANRVLHNARIREERILKGEGCLTVAPESITNILGRLGM